MKKILVTAVSLGALVFATMPASEATPALRHNLVVQLSGTDEGEVRTVDVPGEGPVEALCFDVELIDVASGRVIGTGTDCLYDIQPDGEGLTLVDLTLFHLPAGTIIARSPVAVQPTSLSMPGTSHVTGSIPDERNLLGGTGAFRNASGWVRLSGAVDMSRLDATGEIDFNCIFVIELD